MSHSSNPPRSAVPARHRAPRLLSRFALYLAACWSVPLVLARGLPIAASLAIVAAALYTTVPLLLFLRWRGWPFYPGRAFRLLVVRPVLYGQLALPVIAAAGALGLVLGAPFGAALLVGRALAAVVLAIAAVVLLAGYLGSRALVVREVEARIPDLPPEFDGLRIAQISDLHVGPHTSRAFLRRVTDTVARIRPDMIAVTGDLIDDRAEDVAHYAAALGGLRAPLGTFVVPGNHDVYAGWEEAERGLRAMAGATVLVNDACIVERDGARLAIVGLGDPAGGPRRGWTVGGAGVAPDPARAFAAVPDGVPAVALAHNPVLWPRLAERGARLTLSGHTHWGQLALPSAGWSLASPFLEHAMGGHQQDGALLYISPGTGYWGIPFRIGALPEVTSIVLRRGARAELIVGQARPSGSFGTQRGMESSFDRTGDAHRPDRQPSETTMQRPHSFVRLATALVALVGAVACSQPATPDDTLLRDLEQASAAGIELAPRATGTDVVSAIEKVPAASKPTTSAPRRVSAPRPAPAPRREPTPAPVVAQAPEPAPAPAPVAEAPVSAPSGPTMSNPFPTQSKPAPRGGYKTMGEVIRNAPFPILP